MFKTTTEEATIMHKCLDAAIMMVDSIHEHKIENQLFIASLESLSTVDFDAAIATLGIPISGVRRRLLTALVNRDLDDHGPGTCAMWEIAHSISHAIFDVDLPKELWKKHSRRKT